MTHDSRWANKFTVAGPVVAILAAVLAALLAPQFRVQQIITEGARSTVRAEVEIFTRQLLHEHARFAGAPRIFLVPRNLVASEIKKRAPSVHTVQILRKLPGTILLRLQEKVPLAFLEVPGKVFALDSEGGVIEETSPEDAVRSQLPIVRNDQATFAIAPGMVVVSKAVIDLLHEVVVLLPDRLGANIKELIIPAVGTEEVQVLTDKGWTLLVDAQRSLADQLRSFEQVVAEELKPEEQERLEYVDLRVPGKVFYRLRSR